MNNTRMILIAASTGRGPGARPCSGRPGHRRRLPRLGPARRAVAQPRPGPLRRSPRLRQLRPARSLSTQPGAGLRRRHEALHHQRRGRVSLQLDLGRLDSVSRRRHRREHQERRQRRKTTDSQTDLGVNLLGGIEKGLSNGDRFFIEGKFSLNDVPDAKVTVGWTFYH